MTGFPVEFGIGVRGPKCLNDGPTRWSKKFSDRFSRFDTIPAVTDNQPASHVAVAITLNAKASSLKTKVMFSCSMKDRVEERGKWPCGVCKKGCGNYSILCHGCKNGFINDLVE